MAYCPPEMLEDLTDVFAQVRAWNGIVEKKPHVFYVGSQPFLHFHLLLEGRRRADMKGRTKWVQVSLPRRISPSQGKALLRRLRALYAEKPNRAAAGAGRRGGVR